MNVGFLGVYWVFDYKCVFMFCQPSFIMRLTEVFSNTSLLFLKNISGSLQLAQLK